MSVKERLEEKTEQATRLEIFLWLEPADAAALLELMDAVEEAYELFAIEQYFASDQKKVDRLGVALKAVSPVSRA